MTSANLSLSDKLKTRTKIINRTLWTSLIALPLMAVYYIFGMIMVMTKVADYAESSAQSMEKFFNSKLDGVIVIMGFKSIGWLLAMFIAIMFAYQGFSYLFSQSKLDFYLSQPTTRTQRIRRIFGNAISTYVIMLLAVEAVALIIAAFSGAVNGPVLVNVLFETLRTVVVFIVVYTVTVFAMFLSGNMLTAIILTGFFGFLPALISYEINFLRKIFYATFANLGRKIIYFSPLADRCFTWSASREYKEGLNYNLNYNAVFEFLKDNWRYEVDTIVVGIIALVLLCIAAKARKAEDAGKSITYRPFRWLVKIAVCVVAGIGAAWTVSEMTYTGLNNKMYMLMCIIMVIAAIFVGCLIEILFDNNNIKSFSKGKGQTLMAVAVILLVFFIHRGDLCGYDSYVPNASSVESCAFVDESYNFSTTEHNINVFTDYTEKNMYITDVDTFIEVAKIGMKTQKATMEELRTNVHGTWPDKGWTKNILYRMKDGRKIYRRIVVPYDIDSELLNTVVSSKEYKEGAFEVFHDDALRELEAKGAVATIEYTANGKTHRADSIPYSEISDAYRKDIMENYDFNLDRDNHPMGHLTYAISVPEYAYAEFDVYENFENTLNVLKKYDTYVDPTIDPSSVKQIIVTNFAPGADYDNMTSEEYAVYATGKEQTKVTYEDRECIKQILESTFTSNYYGKWYEHSKYVNQQYMVEIFTDSPTFSRYSAPYFCFQKGKVPDFVVKDTNK